MRALIGLGYFLLTVLWPIRCVVFLGSFVLLFLETFRHELWLEHDARLRLQNSEKARAWEQRAPSVG